MRLASTLLPRRPRYRLLSFVLLVTAFSGCDMLTNPEDAGGFAGTIVKVDTSLGLPDRGDLPLLTAIHVRRGQEACGRIFSIYPDTELFVRRSGQITQVGVDRLMSNRNVRVWQSGETLLSCPGQAVAKRVKLE